MLLVMGKEQTKFSLPGGRVKKKEPSIAAAARELYEETGLDSSKIEWLFPYKGRTRCHRVFRATPIGEVQLKDGELTRYIWWDGKQRIRVKKHVLGILNRMDWLPRS